MARGSTPTTSTTSLQRLHPQAVTARLDSTLHEHWRRPLAPPAHVLRHDPATDRVHLSGATTRTFADPLSALDWIDANRTSAGAGLSGRWVGYLSFELAARFEELPQTAVDDLKLPQMCFVFCPHASLPAGPSAVPRNAATEPGPRLAFPAITSNFARADYEQTIARALDHIAAGDIFQVNIAQRLQLESALSAVQLHARLQRQSPAAYAACLDFGDFAIVSASPELFLHVTPTGRVLTRPIKGTRPNTPGMLDELLHSEKDAAELNMIVDLERNDLGRVCEISSVRVTRPRHIETHPTVVHGVADIEGQLRDDVTLRKLLAATFPGGSITGAPKVRAMEIIDELEPHARGPYCGAVGYLDSDGSCCFNIAIRTAVLKAGTVYVSVGGGIVADSVPADEFEETIVKARAMLNALEVDDDS